MGAAYYVAIVLVAFIIDHQLTAATDIGKLQCTENGIYPDDKLIGIVMQKCQPKLDDPREMLVACMTKCMMKQLKALTKKGKLKKSEAIKLANLLPAEQQDAAKAKFEQCYTDFSAGIKKEAKCDSWVPFSGCFVGWAESLCKQPTTESP